MKKVNSKDGTMIAYDELGNGPAIILVAAVLYILSLLFGPVSGLVGQMFPGRHLEA